MSIFKNLEKAPPGVPADLAGSALADAMAGKKPSGSLFQNLPVVDRGTNGVSLQEPEKKEPQEAPEGLSTPSESDKGVETPPEDKKPVEEAPESKEDPYAPLKERLGDRQVTDFLAEYDSEIESKKSLEIQLEEARQAKEKLYERLVEYDVKNSAEYQEQVLKPQKESEEALLFLFGEDREMAQKALQIYYNKELSSEQKATALKDFASDCGLSLLDVRKAIRDREQAYAKGKTFAENWEKTRTEKQKEMTLKLERERKEMEELHRKTYRTAAYKAEAKVRELGFQLQGLPEAQKDFLSGVEKVINGESTDVESEVMYNILGRMVWNQKGSLKEVFEKLEKFEKAARVEPQKSPGGKETGGGSPNTLTKGLPNPLINGR